MYYLALFGASVLICLTSFSLKSESIFKQKEPHK